MNPQKPQNIYVTYIEGGTWMKLTDSEFPQLLEALQTGTDKLYKAILLGGLIFDCVIRTKYPQRTEIHVTKASRAVLEYLVKKEAEEKSE